MRTILDLSILSPKYASLLEVLCVGLLSQNLCVTPRNLMFSYKMVYPRKLFSYVSLTPHFYIKKISLKCKVIGEDKSFARECRVSLGHANIFRECKIIEIQFFSHLSSSSLYLHDICYSIAKAFGCRIKYRIWLHQSKKKTMSNTWEKINTIKSK